MLLLKRKMVSAITLTLLLAGTLTLAFNIRSVRASGTIYIRADGSIDPLTAPIYTADIITYTLTGNITADGIVVERSNIVIDGNSYTVKGNQSGNGLSLTGISNVTVKNVHIEDFQVGILLNSSSSSTFSTNSLTENMWYGIWLYSSDNNVLSGNDATASGGYGIFLDSSSSNTVSGNNATGNHASGIRLEYSSSNTVSGNIATANVDGFFLQASSNMTISGNNAIANSESGIYVGYSSNNNIDGNNATENSQDGIFLYGASDFNTISGNNATDNSNYGISVIFSSYTTISGNTATANGYDGIYLDWSSNNKITANNVAHNICGLQLLNVSYNTIYHNIFIGNGVQTSIDSASLGNTWNDTYPSGGNYWSDYNGTDFYKGLYQNETGSDGIGDAPYSIDTNNTDKYPLMKPYRTISLLGDMNLDGTVDISDAILATRAFGSKPGDPKWNSLADLNNDNIIDIFDLILLASNFGKTTI